MVMRLTGQRRRWSSRDIRSVVLDGGGGQPLSATDLSPYLDLAANDVTVEVICTLDDTAPDDGLRAAPKMTGLCFCARPWP